VLGAISELSDVELSEVEAAVGSRSFDRGRSYARRNRVAAIEWDATAETLSGSVVGQGALDRTAAPGRDQARPPAWETPLRALIDAPAAQAAGNPLAIEHQPLRAVRPQEAVLDVDLPPIRERAGSAARTRAMSSGCMQRYQRLSSARNSAASRPVHLWMTWDRYGERMRRACDSD